MPAYLTAKQPGSLRAERMVRGPSSGHGYSAVEAAFSSTSEKWLTAQEPVRRESAELGETASGSRAFRRLAGWNSDDSVRRGGLRNRAGYLLVFSDRWSQHQRRRPVDQAPH